MKSFRRIVERFRGINIDLCKGQTGLLAGALLLGGCGEAVYDSIKLMPPPVVYAAGQVDPFPSVTEDNFAERSVLFYVTDRQPATEADAAKYYANARGVILRGGVVTVQATPPISDLDEAKFMSRSPENSPRRLLRLKSVEEYGVLPVGGSDYLPEEEDGEARARTGRAFAAQINKKLANSPQKDIFIYVHGYNVDFDYPVLASKELQHYLGYRGAFIAYSWPATPNRFAYFKDLETADATRKNLRELLVYLSRNTMAEKIHIIGYSAGSRLAFEAVYDLTLQYANGRAGAPRLGQLILIGSDVDRTYFIQSIEDGLLQQTDAVTVYMSSTDSALRVSSIVLGRDRLGQVFVDQTGESSEIIQKLRQTENLSLIDVTAAEGSSFGNGHSYFLASPWASSDMFVSLIYGLDAGERGLERAPDEAYWNFPPDYPERIVRAVQQSR